jgi:hypothetical protein
MFGCGFWDDVRNFVGILLLTFFIPIAGITGMVVAKYLICDVVKYCEVRK